MSNYLMTDNFYKFKILRKCRLAEIRYNYFIDSIDSRIPYNVCRGYEYPIYSGANCGKPLRSLNSFVYELKEIDFDRKKAINERTY